MITAYDLYSILDDLNLKLFSDRDNSHHTKPIGASLNYDSQLRPYNTSFSAIIPGARLLKTITHRYIERILEKFSDMACSYRAPL